MEKAPALQWYRRLAEVPGINYAGPPSVDRTRLPGHDAEPKVEVSTFDEKRIRTVMWPDLYDEKGKVRPPQESRSERQPRSSASPATQHHVRTFIPYVPNQPKPNARALLQNLFEALELPGELDNYHSAILISYRTLWDHRRDDSWVSPTIEKLCLLDIRLLEAYPNFLREAQLDLFEDPPSRLLALPAFEQLIRLYEQEGYLHEAMDVAIRASRMGQGSDLIESVRERFEALQAEGNVEDGTG